MRKWGKETKIKAKFSLTHIDPSKSEIATGTFTLPGQCHSICTIPNPK